MRGLIFSDLCIRVIDKGWLEKLGPQGVREVIGKEVGYYHQRIQGGQYFQVVLISLSVGYGVLLLIVNV